MYLLKFIKLFTFILLILFAVMSCDSIKNLFSSKENPQAKIKTPHGEITIELFPNLAPKHVESFLSLAKKGFYNDTTFHRIIPGFMIQGGDPLSKDQKIRNRHGQGGPGYNIPAEFSDKKHKRGILSAARSNNPDSAGSQFFIMVADAPHLDGQYSIFGQVLNGMDVVDKIVAEPADPANNPLKPMVMEVIVSEEEKSNNSDQN